jgi:undecaprenyl diphosphate synthase
MQRHAPRHIGFIPDGNRRWADARGLPRHAGYDAGIEPGLRLLERCEQLGVDEVSAYAFVTLGG